MHLRGRLPILNRPEAVQAADARHDSGSTHAKRADSHEQLCRPPVAGIAPPPAAEAMLSTSLIPASYGDDSGSGRRIRSGFDGASNRDVADLRGSRRVKSAHGGADSGIAMPVFWLRSVEDRHEQSYSLCYALPSPPTSTFSALVSARQAARCTRKTSRARNLRIENQLRDEAVIAASVVPG